MAAPMATRTTAITNTSDICTDRSRMQPATGMTARLWSPVAAGTTLFTKRCMDWRARAIRMPTNWRTPTQSVGDSRTGMSATGRSRSLVLRAALSPPCGRHRAAAVLAAKGNHAGRRAGAVFLDRTGHHLGHRRRSGGAWCASGESECSLDQRSGTAGALPFKPADHRGWHLRGYSWLAWADPTLSMSPDRAQWQVNEFRARGNTPIPIIREHHDT